MVASLYTYLRYAEAIGLTDLAARQNEQRGAGGRQNGQALTKRIPSEDEVAGYLSDHPEGLRMGEMEAFFNAPRQELGPIVNRLVDDDRARRDEELRMYFPADDEE